MNHLYGRNKKKIKEITGGIIHEFEGEGDNQYIITTYEIFKGVRVFYNDIHTAEITSKPYANASSVRRYEINHCREGRFECVLRDGTITYMDAGDFSINLMSNSSSKSIFPISHYHGVTLCITPSEFDGDMLALGDIFGIKYEDILNHLCFEDGVFLKRATQEIQHIFYEIYRVPDDIVIPYLKVKVQELFLYLTIIDKDISVGEREYFLKTNVDIIKNIHSFVVKNFSNSYTYEKLSVLFSIKPTTMKKCYKTVYGETINKTVKKTRLKFAAHLLKESGSTITDIAIQVGYSDHSKFSKAFKKMYNLTPSEYKKRCLIGHKMPNKTRI
ncbi:MAG: helix-turn-helix transcriptional regulator [Firmicutes bacterium]|nr:helix-turn-helix transcriptional regulator [Bacillota bacterium]